MPRCKKASEINLLNFLAPFLISLVPLEWVESKSDVREVSVLCLLVERIFRC